MTDDEGEPEVEKSVKDILADVEAKEDDERVAFAQSVLDAENEKDEPRKTLVEALEKVVAPADGSGEDA